MASVDGYIRKYGFCNWQVQEVIIERDVAVRALEATCAFWQRRLDELGTLSPEANRVWDVAAAALAVCAARNF